MQQHDFVTEMEINANKTDAVVTFDLVHVSKGGSIRNIWGPGPKY